MIELTSIGIIYVCWRYMLSILIGFVFMAQKKIVTDIQRQVMAANGLDQLVGTQDFDMMVESVLECPQQRAET
ncbi:hypothetical protein HYC85_011991 [Camellia sinensis]|uniref:Uncharacterized protein n=1 Tax=Camellia sinensis TaxID=4442 RepID=A0A7J7HDN5_CAMSI|nr:hypothetical protein HYC85_011991 [Camellia sinensis]